MAISKDKTRLDISLTHATAEKLQLLAIANKCHKSEVIEHLLKAIPEAAPLPGLFREV